VIQYAAAVSFNREFLGILGRPVKPGDDIGVSPDSCPWP
jgi:hypothetical protein